MSVKPQELLEAVIKGQALSEAEEQELVRSLAANTTTTTRLCQLLLNERRCVRGELEQARAVAAKLDAELTMLREPPLFPAEVLRVLQGGRLEVLCANRRQILAAAPELDCSALSTGDEVLLNREMTAALSKNAMARASGVVVEVRDVLGADGLVTLRTLGDEEIVAWCAPGLAETLRSGDRVLFRRESLCVLKKLPRQTTSRFRVEQKPSETFASIGGLDHVISRIRDTLDLALVHKDVSRRFGLGLPSGMMLVGPPGVGKTLLARATANYLIGAGVEASFLNVKPGDLRAVYYGQSEALVRELFAYARSLPGVVIIFMDEVENLGTRDHSPGDRIDGRVLSSILVEIDGLEPRGNIFVITATNRLDLCDDALVRGGRLGTIIEHVPRPGRRGVREILHKHLLAGVENWNDAVGNGTDEIAEAAAGYIFAQSGGPGTLATAVMANAERREISARDVVSGALLKTAADQAKRSAALRHVRQAATDGVLVEDVLDAVDEAFAAESAKLKSPLAARRLLDFHDADQIVRVETPSRKRTPRHRFLTAA